MTSGILNRTGIVHAIVIRQGLNVAACGARPVNTTLSLAALADVPCAAGALRELLAGDPSEARAWVADMTHLDETAAGLNSLLDLMAQRKALVAA